MEISSKGWGAEADWLVERFMIQSQNLDQWAPGNDPPFDYDLNARMPVIIEGERITWDINKNIAFRKNKNGIPSERISTSVVTWTPRNDQRYIEFDIYKPRGDMGEYQLQVFVAKGPAGPANVIRSINLGTEVPGNVTEQLPAGFDLLGIRLRRTSEVKKAKRRRVSIKNLKWGSIWRGGTYTLADAFGGVLHTHGRERGIERH